MMISGLSQIHGANKEKLVTLNGGHQMSYVFYKT